MTDVKRFWRPQVMGIVNVTPDSFADGGVNLDPKKAVASALAMMEAGASIIDIGGESTRPGAQPVGIQEECDRVLPVIEALQSRCSVDISIDTRHTAVMKAALSAGASMVNDVYALQDEGALEIVAQAGVPVCLMHMQGQPENMQDQPEYDNVIDEVFSFLKARKTACVEAGIRAENIIIDPGFGFGKSLDHNLALLNHLSDFKGLDCPILVGMSRKSMIGKLVMGDAPAQRVAGSIAAHTIAWMNGAQIVRAHDVPETMQALRVFNGVMAGETK
jgi:dihydropteroate synthase